MTTVYVICEGQTERTFVVRVLTPYLANTNPSVTIVPSAVITSIGARTHRGGITTYSQLKSNILHALQSMAKGSLVTTLADLYAFPFKTCPWAARTPKMANPLQWVEEIEREFAADIGDYRFHAYLSLHEFESLVLAHPSTLVEQVLRPNEGEDEASFRVRADTLLDEIEQLVSALGSPEHVNDGASTAPSKRILRWTDDRYSKVLYGESITSIVGIDRIRQRCQHFHNWIEWLEAVQ